MSPFGSRRGPAHRFLRRQCRRWLGSWDLRFMKRRFALGGKCRITNDRIFGVAASGAMDEAKLLAILEAAAARA